MWCHLWRTKFASWIWVSLHVYFPYIEWLQCRSVSFQGARETVSYTICVLSKNLNFNDIAFFLNSECCGLKQNWSVMTMQYNICMFICFRTRSVLLLLCLPHSVTNYPPNPLEPHHPPLQPHTAQITGDSNPGENPLITWQPLPQLLCSHTTVMVPLPLTVRAQIAYEQHLQTPHTAASLQLCMIRGHIFRL